MSRNFFRVCHRHVNFVGVITLQNILILGKKDRKPAVNLSPEELNEIVNFEKMKSQMDMALEHVHKAGVLHTTHNQEHVRYVHEHMKQEYFTQLTVRNTSGMFMNT